MQPRRALAMELHLSWTNPLICKTEIPLKLIWITSVQHICIGHIQIYLAITALSFGWQQNKLWSNLNYDSKIVSSNHNTPPWHHSLLTSVAAGGRWPVHQVCAPPCCSRHIWLGPRRRPAGRRSRVDSRSRHWGSLPSLARRTCAARKRWGDLVIDW